MTHIISQFNLHPAPPLLHEFPFFYTARHRPLNWKKGPKATGAPRPCFFKVWIIDSLRLVIYRLHMQLIHQQEKQCWPPNLVQQLCHCYQNKHTCPRTHTHTRPPSARPTPLNKEPGAWKWIGEGHNWQGKGNKMIDGVHCGIMNELCWPNTLSRAVCQPVSILILEEIWLSLY